MNMNRRRSGLILLNMAGILVILGSLYDLLVPAVPANHLLYLGRADGQLDARYAVGPRDAQVDWRLSPVDPV